MSASIIARPDLVAIEDATESILIPASCSTFPSRCSSEVRDSVIFLRYRITSRAAFTFASGMKLPASSPHSSRCTSHSASAMSVLRPGTFLTCPALHTSKKDQPGAVAQAGLVARIGTDPF